MLVDALNQDLLLQIICMEFFGSIYVDQPAEPVMDLHNVVAVRWQWTWWLAKPTWNQDASCRF